MNNGIKPKQAGIILTLLVGIICVGLLAHRVNTQLTENGQYTSAEKGNDKGSEGKTPAKETGKENKEANEKSKDYFYELKSTKEQEDQKSIQNLRAIIADENTSKEQKEKATEELTRKTTNANNESRIELNIKSKGFAEAVCFIQDDTARVVVNKDSKLTEKETLEIQDIVKNVAQIYDVQIELAK